jgi:hypothetical protein
MRHKEGRIQITSTGSKLLIRHVQEEDHAVILEWFRARQIGVVQASHFSRSGVMVDEVIAGFVYKDPSATIAYLDNVVSDPTAPKHRTATALLRLYPALLSVARLLGAEFVLGFTTHQKLARICQKHGANVWGVALISGPIGGFHGLR